MMDIRKGDDHDLADAAGLDLESIPGGHDETVVEFEEEQRKLKRAGKISKTMTIIMVSLGLASIGCESQADLLKPLALLVLWPMPMYGSGYIFSKPFFPGWVTIGIIWIFCSFFAVGLFPVFEGRRTLVNTAKYIFLDITGKQHPKAIHGQEPVAASVTPTEKTANEDVGGKE